MCCLQSPFYQPDLNYYVLGKRIREAKYTPVPDCFSEPLRKLIAQMLAVNPADRPTAAQVFDYCSQAYAHFAGSHAAAAPAASSSAAAAAFPAASNDD
jgi:hypothetical protein